MRLEFYLCNFTEQKYLCWTWIIKKTKTELELLTYVQKKKNHLFLILHATWNLETFDHGTFFYKVHELLLITFHLLSSFDYFLRTVAGWRLGPRCLPMGHLPGKKPSLSIPASFTPLFNDFLLDISLMLRLVLMRCHNHHIFIKTPSLGRPPTKAKNPNPTIRHSYPLPDVNTVL